MRIIFINQYHPPDAAPTGVMLRDVAARAAADGHDVTILCASGGYATAGNGTVHAANPPGPCNPRVVRVGATRFGRASTLAKLADYASFYAGVAWQLLRRPSDRIVALTTPPYLSILARLCSKLRGGDHAHWVMDLYPDVMTAHGMIREGGPGHRLLAAAARWGMGGGRCAAVVTLGPDMARRVDALCRRPDSARWVPLWHHPEGLRDESSPGGDPGGPRRLRASRGWAEDEAVVMYSGNMGLGHCFAEILEAASLLRDRPVRFEFFGRGRRREEIAAFIQENPDVRAALHDYAPQDVLADHLQTADIHLASLRPEWDGTMVPSKLQGIFAAGRPVVFIGTETSSIGRWVMESGGGRVVRPGDPAALAAAIIGLLDPAARATAASAAREFAKLHFAPETNIARTAGHLTAP